MTKPAILDDIKAMVRRRNTLEAPSVDLIMPEVRTDMNFRVGKGSAKIVDQVQKRIKSGDHIGFFVAEWGYDVASAQVATFQKNLNDIEQRLTKKPPKGVAYKGTYLVYMSSDKSGGRYRTFWAFETMAAIEAMGSDDADKDFRQAVAELSSFVDRSNGAGLTQALYQTAAGTQVFQGG
jgi:hypothetical protein